jgi:RHS repeat-associated protein
VLTSIGLSGQSSGTWSVPGGGGLDGLRQVAQEQNSVVKRAATGKALGAATVGAKPVGVTYNGVDSDGRWRCLAEMPPGSHTLRVWANHPSGQYTAYATNTFTLSTNGFDTTLDQYDAAGNVTQRVWKNASGTTNRTQTLTWDAFGRMLKVTERDAQTNGFNWAAVYDGLGRRLRTTTTMVLTNVPVTSPASAVSVVDSYFDPEVEFLEVGVSVNGIETWKSHGPDLDQNYGGLQGVGGLDYVYVPNEINPTTLITDVFGNVQGSVTNGTVSWKPARMSSYGPLPGYPSQSLSANVSLVEATAWRGRRVDQTGLVLLGARYYDPIGGRFLSADPLGHASDPSLFSFANGDPVNYFDADGRLGKPVGSLSDRMNSRANMPAWLAAATAETCMDCHGNLDVLMGGYLPYDQPWFNPNGNNAYANAANWFQPRAGGFVKVGAGIAGMAGSGFLEGGSWGTASPIALPAFAGSSALYASGLRQIVNGDSVTLSQQLVKRGADPESAAILEFMLNSSALVAPGQLLKPGRNVTGGNAMALTRGIPGDASFVGPVKPGWTLAPAGQGAHLVERVNVLGRPNLGAFDQIITPRFYPRGTPESAGAAHIRLHQATREAGIGLRQGSNASLTDAQLLQRYRQAYSNPRLNGIRGDLRTPDGGAVIASDVTPADAFEALLLWFSGH